ncbi:LysR substrate-binding domain-containing protein [Cupriavidus basilensis]|uniref:LysR substrate-binding domain-containing protein n=1 Tax=Cupriavidus basilensis TaxID=68895 RepID=UPI0020A626F9|nr:LysR substrate-binding domain-containing protein [Cupriavidus basilensis]MCP3019101.1 LysR substrate-binding domain-containing protein [Cupriavidus basilensis]MDR3385295.1 LysR substrate-binding domain-containing protein [Cupriavidus basilensis]
MGQPAELAFFSALVKAGSLSAAARELDVTPAAVSKRLAQLETRLGVRLLNRTTRRIGVTAEGEVYLEHAQRILADIEDLDQLLASGRVAPRGLLRVNAPLGFGRTYIAPAISAFAKRHAQVEVQLHLTDRPINLGDEGFDVGIRFGEMPDARLIARKIADNRRLVCAAPSYLKAHGTPSTPHDLAQHQCIVLRQNDSAYGIWRFTKGKKTETVKVRGPLSSNDGEVTLTWGLDGQGILQRAEWDLAKYLRSGRLVLLLEDYALPPADIYAVFPERHNMSAKVRAFLDFLVAHFEGKLAKARGGPTAW